MNIFDKIYESVQLKDIRGNIARMGDYVYILPQGIQDFNNRHATFDLLKKFKNPYAYVIGAREDQLLLESVKVISFKGKSAIVKRERFRGMRTGRVVSIKRSYCVKLTPEECRDINNFQLG